MTMECIGARNFAAMAVSACPNWRSRSKRPGIKQNRLIRRYNSWCKLSLRARCSSSAGNETCVAVKEEFADEEDYVKAGGSELLFVQMQQNKDMDKQSKLTDKVDLLFVSNSSLFFQHLNFYQIGFQLKLFSTYFLVLNFSFFIFQFYRTTLYLVACLERDECYGCVL